MRKAKPFLQRVFILFILLSLVSCTPPIATHNPATSTAIISTPTTEPDTTATATIAATATATATIQVSDVPPLSFIAEADARVDESEPGKNYGDSTYLQVNGGDEPNIESFIRFTITGISGAVRSARLRLYNTTNASKHGSSIYATDAAWNETEITWVSRPGRISGSLDSIDSTSEETWVEYDVTSFVTGDGTFSFVLATDSRDAVTFSSRQGAQPPQLVIAFGPDLPATATPEHPPEEVVFVGAGDISDCDNDNDELTAQLLDTIPGTVFTTGDNVYSSGTSAQFTDCYDPTWGRHKDRTKPIPGNHDYRTSDGAGYYQYFNNISPYYAYDLGSWRIYALNTEIDASENSAQVTWLQSDLAANPRQCILAYWHKPRWSSGDNHGSNPEFHTLWQIFYEAGAEVVLNGHEHNYERFAPMNAAGEADPLGLREFVVGTGGKSHYGFGTVLPNSEVRDETSYGVLKLILRSSGYDWEFIPAAGSIFTDSGSAECH
jgi:hypothetical protein